MPVLLKKSVTLDDTNLPCKCVVDCVHEPDDCISIRGELMRNVWIVAPPLAGVVFIATLPMGMPLYRKSLADNKMDGSNFTSIFDLVVLFLSACKFNLSNCAVNVLFGEKSFGICICPDTSALVISTSQKSFDGDSCTRACDNCWPGKFSLPMVTSIPCNG